MTATRPIVAARLLAAMTPPRKAAAGGCASGVAGCLAAALAGAALRTVTVRRLFPAEIVVLIASASDSSQWMSACARAVRRERARRPERQSAC